MNMLNSIFNQNIINQARQLEQNPGIILDILLQNGKINYQQYQEMQNIRNNPEQIVSYLENHGNGQGIRQAQLLANNMMNR